MYCPRCNNVVKVIKSTNTCVCYYCFLTGIVNKENAVWEEVVEDYKESYGIELIRKGLKGENRD